MNALRDAASRSREYWPFYLGFLLLVFVLLAVDLGRLPPQGPRRLDPRGRAAGASSG